MKISKHISHAVVLYTCSIITFILTEKGLREMIIPYVCTLSDGVGGLKKQINVHCKIMDIHEHSFPDNHRLIQNGIEAYTFNMPKTLISRLIKRSQQSQALRGL